jgi:hypothetical protein
MKNVRLLSHLVQYLVSTFTTAFFFSQLLVVGVVSGGACAGSTFPIFVANDKGDTKIFAFDYNLGANRLVIAG